MRYLTILLALLTVTVQAAEITLTDGSTVRGDIVSMSNGVYQVQTQSMGMVQLQSSQVARINQSGVVQAEPLTNQLGKSSVESIQSTIVNSPGLMSSIMALQNDQEVQAILADPELMRAIQGMDFETLQNHPKIKALMNNRNVQAITGQMGN